MGKFLSEKEQSKPLLKELTNAPHSGRGFLTNSPSPGPYKMKTKKARQIPGGMGTLGID